MVVELNCITSEPISYATDDDISNISTPLLSMAQNVGDDNENVLYIAG